jgi:hypothetical protein
MAGRSVAIVVEALFESGDCPEAGMTPPRMSKASQTTAPHRRTIRAREGENFTIQVTLKVERCSKDRHQSS